MHMETIRLKKLSPLPEPLISAAHAFLMASIPGPDEMKAFEVKYRQKRKEENPKASRIRVYFEIVALRRSIKRARVELTPDLVKNSLETGLNLALGANLNVMYLTPQNPQTRKICTPTTMDSLFLEQVVRCARLPQSIGSQIEAPLCAFFYSLAGKVLPYASVGQFTIKNDSGDLYLEKLAQPQAKTRPRPPQERAKIFRLDD